MGVDLKNGKNCRLPIINPAGRTGAEREVK